MTVNTRTITIAAAAMGIPSIAYLLTKLFRGRTRTTGEFDAETTDPGLLRKNSTFECYKTSVATYPAIRTFFTQHQHADKLPEGLPLLVFIHGLGGSVAQFHKLLESLVNSAPCLAIDFPGCGRSEFAPKEDNAYTKEALAELVAVAIERYREKSATTGSASNGQKVVLIAHSMGSTIAALLASSNSPVSHLLADQYIVLGCIAICPSLLPPTNKKQIKGVKFLQRLPSFLFDLFRMWDKRGGINSSSVIRFVGVNADVETKRLQLRWNEQSKTKVFQKMLNTIVPPGTSSNGATDRDAKTIWSSIRVPTFLIAGEDDHVTPPSNAQSIMSWLTAHEAAAVTEPQPASQQNQHRLTSSHEGVSIYGVGVQLTYFPSPAGHAIMYTANMYHVLARLIEKFNAQHVDEKLDQSWQLQHLTTSGKWDVKNLAKWEKISPCSEPIGQSPPTGTSPSPKAQDAKGSRIVFRAMKTMREVDPVHNPTNFASIYGFEPSHNLHGVIAIVDISHDMPVYKPESLAPSGIEYHKFPTVSKLPPNNEEVASFIAKIEGLAESDSLKEKLEKGGTIAVHCHYGFNRTGFLIVAFLVERMGWGVQEAIDDFTAKREPGIKHSHFVDELWVRYGGR
ncbi:alpha/beta-hydrolase [Polychaeton citri CBS 116435]|uniref:Alpha/beta-hydrolase n=1 Tax=Polychaeton citri CBS 116435 TaxID=1314669 RepID=A0A9P4Q9W5_9PEZI|nr:alpha/beta-hydrolase [Polychaeton citri CBS 116435]